MKQGNSRQNRRSKVYKFILLLLVLLIGIIVWNTTELWLKKPICGISDSETSMWDSISKSSLTYTENFQKIIRLLILIVRAKAPTFKKPQILKDVKLMNITWKWVYHLIHLSKKLNILSLFWLLWSLLRGSLKLKNWINFWNKNDEILKIWTRKTQWI